MKDILWCSPHPNHYHQFLIDSLNASGLTIDEVYFQKVISKYPWKSNFNGSNSAVLKRGFANVDWKFLFDSRQWSKYKQVIIAGWNEPTMILLIVILILRSKNYIIYTDTPKEIPRKGIKQYLRKVWLDMVLRKSTFVFSTGKPGVDFFVSSGVPKYKVVNFPFLTNLMYFKPTDQKKRSDIPIIFSSGRLVNSHKGYDIAILALANIKKQGTAFSYRIAGEGPDRKALEELIKSSDLEKHVELLGWLEPNDLLNEYGKANIFLHSARLDPYPNAILEAMACGLPVISSDKSGSGVDRIIQDVNGKLFISGDVQDLTLQLQSALGMQSEEIEKMGNNARVTALKWGPKYHITTIKAVLQAS